ncbi:MAG TPA: hypothetical protein VGB74_21005 [Actinoplanes sp.]
MTTQTPYEPPQHGAYPTSPPWVTPPDPPQQPPQLPGPPWGDMQYTNQHGQLMVPYPEKMRNAVGPKPPPWYPVVLFTFFFGPLGAISAARRAGRVRNGRQPYWIAFGATMAVWVALLLICAALTVPVLLAVREQALTKVVQENAAAKTGIASATCEPVGARAADGRRAYQCALRLDDGRTGTARVTADAEGNLLATK